MLLRKCELRVKAMKEITKEQYLQDVNDFEKMYLIAVDGGRVFLRADIERGGEVGLRIETMNFELDTAFGFWQANVDCRGRYAGGISFIEYENYDEAESRVMDDFVGIADRATFVYCGDGELKNIASVCPDGAFLYARTE